MLAAADRLRHHSEARRGRQIPGIGRRQWRVRRREWRSGGRPTLSHVLCLFSQNIVKDILRRARVLMRNNCWVVSAGRGRALVRARPSWRTCRSHSNASAGPQRCLPPFAPVFAGWRPSRGRSGWCSATPGSTTSRVRWLWKTPTTSRSTSCRRSWPSSQRRSRPRRPRRPRQRRCVIVQRPETICPVLGSLDHSYNACPLQHMSVGRCEN